MDRTPAVPGTGIAAWSTAAWRELAVAWLDERLAAVATIRTGPVTQPRLRPWGTVLTATTTRGPVWLKAPGPETAFEVPLYRILARAAPQWSLRPIATDVQRGWVLLPHGGHPLSDRLPDDAEVDALVAVLPQYGQLQREIAPHIDELLSAGVEDMRAAVMPQRFEEALAAVGHYVDQYGDATDREIFRRIATMRDTVQEWCDRLAAAVVPASLDHNDLHLGNVLPVHGRLDHVRFFDWGDSVVAHPFATMLVGLSHLVVRLGVDPQDPAVRRPRDAYLEVFTDLAPRTELIAELELACRIAKIARALTWQRALGPDGPDSEFARVPLVMLSKLISESWLSLR